MAKEWYTADELAGLEGLPTSARRVRSKATSEGWESRKRPKGKGFEYHLDSLPEITRADLAKIAAEEAINSPMGQCGTAVAVTAHPEKVVDKDAQVRGIKQLILLPEQQRKRADARLLILQAANAYIQPYIRARQRVIGEKAFARSYTERSLELPSWVYDTVKTVSWMSLRRWQETLDTHGAAALAGRYKPALKTKTKIDEQLGMADFLKALLTSKPHLIKKRRHLLEILTMYSKKNQLEWDIPSSSAIGRWVNAWYEENQAAITYMTDPNKYNSKYRSAVETAYPWMKMPNDVWEFDSTPVDAMLKDGRHSIIAVIDCLTRRAKLLVSPTSDSEGICLLLRKTILDWGLLNEKGIVKTDNGSDYVSKRTSAVFNLLGMDQERAKPYSGWEKPFIERFFRTMSHGLVEMLPGYIGHNVADREVIEAAKHFAQRLAEKRKPESEKEGFELRLTRDELQTLLDSWIEGYYNHRPHSGKGMDGKSPFQKYMDTGYKPRVVVDEGALDILLNHVGDATVLKGLVKSGGLEYSAPELMDHEWKGKKVSVFLDPNDVGRAFLYRINDWTTRVEAHDIRLIGQGISPEAYRQRKRDDEKALRRFRKEAKQLAKTFGVDGLHQDAVDHFTEQAKKLMAFPSPTREHNNDAIAALAETADRLKNPADPQYSEKEIETLNKQREYFEAQQEAVNQQQGLIIRNEHDKARLLAEQSHIRQLSNKEQQFLTDYKRNNRFGGKEIERIMARQQQKSD